MARAVDSFSGFLASKLPSARFARLATVSGLVWLAFQALDRFQVLQAPTGFPGLLLFALIAGFGFLLVEFVLSVAGERGADGDMQVAPPTAITPEHDYATSVMALAETSANHSKDQFLLELRGSSSRILHLLGFSAERRRLGELALASASALKDRQSQAEILIDDLGWSLHQEDEKQAIHNIKEALDLLDGLPQTDATTLLRIKALRHLANIQGRVLDLPAARRLFDAPKALSSPLSGDVADHALGQLEHSEAEIILSHVVRPGVTLGVGADGALLQEADDLAASAANRFAGIGDVERLVKALRLRQNIVSHLPDAATAREVKAELARVEQRASRSPSP